MKGSGSWRKRVVDFTCSSILYVSLAFGLLPFKYDASCRKLSRSKWLICYSIVLNGGLVWMTLTLNVAESLPLEEEIFRRSPLSKQISSLLRMLSLSTTLLAFFRTWWRSGELASVLNEFMELDTFFSRHYSYKMDMRSCLVFDNYIVYKAVFIVLEISSTLFTEYSFSPISSWHHFVGILALATQHLEVLLMSMHFYLAVIHTYRYIWTINRQLLRLANNCWTQDNVVDVAEVERMLQVYKRLLELNDRLVILYDLQSLLLMMTLLWANIITAFFFVVINFSLRKMTAFMALVVIPQITIINCWDFWLSIAVCERATCAGRATPAILKLFSDFPKLEGELERALEMFALWLSHCRLRYRYCGLFYMDNALGFKMLVTGVLYWIVLVQFDFMNL
ncbi:gustatory receptor for bitter taste 22e-like [Scaptodrosophila lebanonensis]|uniref:Gustatory receptor n=1 Tax=Drosophila lebanonensis TaxID=7225 RepID=A0A6J2U5U9_DROLE|nr:gustatory receptor for bitter taste 22e-like [Scaptodrosophila lebanonensis]